MITKEKIKIYNHFKGDIDGWARLGTSEQKAIMNDNDWFLIENLIQEINLVAKGLATETFSKSIFQKLKENCDIEETAQKLKNMTNLK